MLDPQVEGNFLTLVIGFESNFPSLDSAISKARTLLGLDDRKEENSNSSLICLFIEKFNWK